MDLLSTSQAASALAVTAQTVRRWADTGKLCVVVLPSGQYRIPASEIERILTPAQLSPDAVQGEDQAALPGQTVLL